MRIGIIAASMALAAMLSACGDPKPKAEAAASAPAKPDMPQPLQAAVDAAGNATGLHKDKFADPMTVSLGQRFSLTLTPSSGDKRSEAVGAYWTYEEGVLRYTVGSGLNGFQTPGRDWTIDIGIHARMEPGDAYEAQNAFGAKARVEVEMWRQASLSVTSGPRAERSHGRVDIMPPDDYPLELRVNGETARRLTQSIVLVIDGEVANIGGQKQTATCVVKYYEPTPGNPTDRTIENCFVGAIIDRIAYVDTSTGKVLREFVRPAPKAKS